MNQVACLAIAPPLAFGDDGARRTVHALPDGPFLWKSFASDKAMEAEGQE